MAKKIFILQGFTPNTHAQAVRELFDVPDIKKVILSVAFVSESGVQQIEAALRAHAAHVTVFAGVRNDITSHQGLTLLHSIGVKLYTVDTGSRTVIFHPKLYLVRGKTHARFVVGSANLTLGGLNNNIEAGMLLDFNLAEEADKAVVDEIEAQLTALPTNYPEHIVKVGAVVDLHKMLASSRIVDEAVVVASRPRVGGSESSVGDTIPRIKLKVEPLYGRPKATQPSGTTKRKQPTTAGVGLPSISALTDDFQLMWESKPLSRRSLTIPNRPGSNPTGSSTLGKGLFEGIDPVSYFRKNIFGHLPWASYQNRAGALAEKVDAEFDLVIKGVMVGNFLLTLRHSLTRARAAKTDKNLPTEISWNRAKPYIQRDDLLDRTMRIFRSLANPSKFRIDID
ncbi:MAG: hypothetical protein ACYC05_07045 [Sulfuricella sp.]